MATSTVKPAHLIEVVEQIHLVFSLGFCPVVEHYIEFSAGDEFAHWLTSDAGTHTH